MKGSRRISLETLESSLPTGTASCATLCVNIPNVSKDQSFSQQCCKKLKCWNIIILPGTSYRWSVTPRYSTSTTRNTQNQFPINTIAQKHQTTMIYDDTIIELQIRPGNKSQGPIFNSPHVHKISTHF